MMTLDQLVGTSFFMPAVASMGEQSVHSGGSPLLFQHLFWFFGHPEVYIVALPAFGIVSDLLSTHARRNIFGYRMMVWAILAIGCLSFVVWAHHMYVSGMNPYFGFFFATTTLIIAVPTAIKVYNWVLTLWRGDIHLTVPMLFAIGFIFTFINGGLTGPVPRQRHRRRAAVGHVLRGRALPHGDGRVADPGGVRRDLSLVSEDHRPDARRPLGKHPLLVRRSSARTRSTCRCTTSAFSACRAATTPTATASSSFRPSVHERERVDLDRGDVRRGHAAGVPVQPRVVAAATAAPSGPNPWRATTLEWQTPDTPPKHGNWGKDLPVVLSLGVRLQRARRAGGLHSAERAARSGASTRRRAASTECSRESDGRLRSARDRHHRLADPRPQAVDEVVGSTQPAAASEADAAAMARRRASGCGSSSRSSLRCSACSSPRTTCA